jgi:hypothetical protein
VPAPGDDDLIVLPMTEDPRRNQEEPVPARAEVLREAEQLICGARAREYGPPAKNFQTIAELWGPYMRRVGLARRDPQPHEVAALMALLKVARMAQSPEHRDSHVDAAGYVAIAAELASD